MELELFSDINDVRKYAQGVNSDVRIDSLYSSYNVAVERLKNFLGAAVFDAIKKDNDTNFLPLLKTAIANQMMYEYTPFLNLNKEKEQRMYKYQLDELREQYITSAWVATDSLLSILEIKKQKEFSESDLYKSRNNLIIKSGPDMNEYYNIGNSAYFFYKTIYLQKEIIAGKISTRIHDLSAADENILDAVKRVLVYNIIALAVQTFEISELPLNMRKKFGNEFTQDATGFALTRDKLYAVLMAKVSDYYNLLDQKLAAMKDNVNLDNNNDPKKKFYISM